MIFRPLRARTVDLYELVPHAMSAKCSFPLRLGSNAVLGICVTSQPYHYCPGSEGGGDGGFQYELLCDPAAPSGGGKTAVAASAAAYEQEIVTQRASDAAQRT